MDEPAWTPHSGGMHRSKTISDRATVVPLRISGGVRAKGWRARAPTHVSQLFEMMAGINMIHITYRGGAPALVPPFCLVTWRWTGNRPGGFTNGERAWAINDWLHDDASGANIPFTPRTISWHHSPTIVSGNCVIAGAHIGHR